MNKPANGVNIRGIFITQHDQSWHTDFSKPSNGRRFKTLGVRSKPTQPERSSHHLAHVFADNRAHFSGFAMRSIEPHRQKYFHRATQILLAKSLHHGSKPGSNPWVSKIVTSQPRRNENKFVDQLRIGDREVKGDGVIG